MGKGSSPPPEPDYKGAADATAQGNLEMAQYATKANRVNQVSPWGQSTWTSTGGKAFDQAGYDAAMSQYQAALAAKNAGPGGQWVSKPTTGYGYQGDGETYEQVWVPDKGAPLVAPNRDDFYSNTPEKWTQTITVDPKLQAALDAQINIQKNRSEYANDLLDRVKNSYATEFNAPELNDYLQGVLGLNQEQLKSGDYTKGLPGLDYNTPEAQQYFKDVLALNQNAPVLDAEARKRYEKAAFDSADGLLSRRYNTDEQSLRDSLALQGLNPMSQASGQATSSFYDSKNAAYNQLANQSILTGNQMANADYASQLAGFNATNAARGQAFTQANQSFANALQQYAASNAVRQQGYNNAMTSYGADLQGQGTANAARQQAYANAMNRWQSEYAAAKNKRDMPLNELNALLTGQQVQMPQFPGYAMQANVAGPDIMGATNAQYQGQLGAWNAQQASDSSTTGSVLGAAATIGAAML